jgi:hypothetical protein
MKYLTTSMYTDWPEKEPWYAKLIMTLLFFIPRGNPGYDSKMYLVKKWLIEFIEHDGELKPWREIALDVNGSVLFAGPDERNYGFWLDTDIRYEDFEGEPIDKDEFERCWLLSGVKALE